jgi:hypothetical protein
MRRPTHVCATCSEHFTRRYSATRHNFSIHKGTGEIVTYLEYLVGRNSGRYRPSHPSLYRKGRGEKRIHDFGHATVTADSMGDIVPPRGLQQETLSRSTPLPLPPASTAQPHPLALTISNRANISTPTHSERSGNCITGNHAKASRTQKTGLGILALMPMQLYNALPISPLMATIRFLTKSWNSFAPLMPSANSESMWI